MNSDSEDLDSNDLYEEVESKRGKDQREHVGAYDLDLPEDFEDEEIDEDEAFNEDDEVKFGHFFKKSAKRDQRDLASSSDERSSGESEDNPDESESESDGYVHISDLLEVPNDEMHDSLLARIEATMAGSKNDKTVNEATEGVKEGVYNMPSSASRVSMVDLLSNLGEHSQFKTLRREMIRIQTAQENAVATPTPEHVRDRELRTVQYEETKEVISDWQPTVNQMKQSSHLSFPLNQERVSLNVQQTVDNFTPETDLEKAISQAIGSSTIDDQKLFEAEILGDRDVDVDDLEARERELQKMKHMLYYKERKFKWHKRIKSRKYRKILRKAKERGKLTLEELRELDPEAARSEEMKLERERATERMTLKHKEFGKWAQGAKQSKNPLLKQALNEHHQLSKQLRKKIDRIDEDASSDGSEMDDSDAESSIDEEVTEPTKGVMAMKFMQRARDRQRKEYEEMKEAIDSEFKEKEKQLKRRLGDVDSDEDKPSSSDLAPEADDVGRRNFSGSKYKKARIDAAVELVSESFQTPEVAHGEGFLSSIKTRVPIPLAAAGTMKSVERLQGKKGELEPKKPFMFEMPDADVEPEIGPDSAHVKSYNLNEAKIFETESDVQGTAPVETGIKTSRKSSAASSANPWLDGDDDEPVTEKISKRKRESDKPQRKSKRMRVGQIALRALPSDQPEVGQDAEEFNLMANASAEQKERAFANDNVELEFEENKSKEVQGELPQDLTVSLPGWGSWSGEGLVVKPKASDSKRKEEQDKRNKELLASRKDAKLKHVVINHKRDKKFAKFMLLDVPSSYASEAAFEHSLRNPLGKEWNTQTSHRRLVEPRVTAKVGSVIEPISKKMKPKDDSNKRSPNSSARQNRKSMRTSTNT